MPLLQRIRLRVLAVLVGAILAVVGAVTFASLPAWPVIGVAVITVAAVVNSMTTRLNQPICMHCGGDLGEAQAGAYGVVCPCCGHVNQRVAGRLANLVVAPAQSGEDARDGQPETEHKHA